LRRFILACAGLLAFSICAITSGSPQAIAAGRSGSDAERRAAIDWLGTKVYGFERATWRWERLMGVRLTPTEGRVLTEMSVPDVESAVALWRRRAAVARRRAARPPHLAAWLCIHRYEGSWRANTGNGYYGGLQMNLGFQRAYASWLVRRKGTADRWTPLEQIWTAEKALRSRGFWPWPNTARYCGLI
jgi:transglycosylase-like protein